jgi:PAS domain S-box-containing protein
MHNSLHYFHGQRTRRSSHKSPKPWSRRILHQARLTRNRLYGELAHAICSIAKSKKTEDALIKSEERWATTLESSGDAVIATDTFGKVTFMNAVAEKLTGWTLNEASQKPVNQVFRIFDEQTHLKVDDLVDRVFEKGLVTGLVHPAILIRKDGTEVAIDDSAAPILNEAGKLTGAVLVFRDITEHKRIEKKLEDSRNKMEIMNEKRQVIGRLTRHDVQNKLSRINGNAFVLKKKYADYADIIDRLDKMEQAVNEAGQLFDFAKIYEQLGVEELVYINVEKTLCDAVGLFSDSLALEVINDCHGLTLLADSLLRQMLYNFIDNTLKHAKKATTMSILRKNRTRQTTLNL